MAVLFWYIPASNIKTFPFIPLVGPSKLIFDVSQNLKNRVSRTDWNRDPYFRRVVLYEHVRYFHVSE